MYFYNGKGDQLMQRRHFLSRYSLSDSTYCISLQVNHFPGSQQLGRKDRLHYHLSKARRVKGAAFDYFPQTFILPRDLAEFKGDIERNPDRLYIQKVCTVLANVSVPRQSIFALRKK